MPNAGNVKSGSKLDRFQKIFVPSWLLQASETLDVYLVPSSIENNFDYQLYSSGIYPQGILSKFDRDSSKVKDRIKREWSGYSARPGIAALSISNGTKTFSKYTVILKDLPELSERTYARRFAPLLRLEYSEIELELHSARLYNVSVTRVEGMSEQGYYYAIPAKSIREGYPPVDLGDQIELRRVEDGYFDQISWISVVWAINRAKGEIIVRADELIQEKSARFNVLFKAQSNKFFAFSEGVESLDLFLYPHSTPADLTNISTELASSLPISTNDASSSTRKILFPHISDLPPSLSLPLPTRKLQNWYDNKLNPEQRKAVEAIVLEPAGIPVLVFGPPGTGKTSTVCEATLQAIRHSPTASILLVGASNPSADTLALRLSKYLSPKQLLRLNDSSRPLPEINQKLLAWAYIKNDRFAMPPIDVVLNKRVIVCSAVDAVLLLRSRLTNSALAILEHRTRSVLNPLLSIPVLEPHFSHLIIDEAGQAHEPELSIALAVIANNPLCSNAKVVLCGDVMQLAPRIISSEARDLYLDESLMERLSRRKVYKTPAGLESSCFHLVRNYRSHPAILMLPSTLFYEESLIACAIPSPDPIKFDQVSPLFPVLLITPPNGVDEPIDEGCSFYNEVEVETVVNLVKNILAQNPSLKPSEISIIAAFREQVWRIRLALREIGFSSVDVGNTEALQGGENRVVIISTVRTNPRWLKGDFERGSGFIKEPKRFNVAITRSKEMLIVVGNVEILITDPNWKSFYLMCKRNGAYQGQNIILGEENHQMEYISKLEVEFRAKGTFNLTSLKENEVEFDVLVGSMARNALS